MEAPPRLLVLTPPDEVPAVGLVRAPAGVVLIVKLTFRGEEVVASALSGDEFAAPKPTLEVSVDGEVIDAPRKISLGAALDLGPRGVFALPGVEPNVTLCNSELEDTLSVPMICDTLAIRQGELALTWRGEVDELALTARDRVLVTLGEALGDLARAQVSFAQTPETPEAVDAEILALERLALAGKTPQPVIVLESYAAISAELAEQREPRGEVLARHGFDEHGWSLEERAWLERMGRAALDGDASVATTYAEHFVAAQDALGSSEEADAMIHEYVAVSVELERADDPMAVLGRWSLSLAQWMRLDRHWSRRAEADERLKAEIEHMLAVERERRKDVE